MAGAYDKVIALGKKAGKGISPVLADTVSWAYVGQGNSILEEARTERGEKADHLFAKAGEAYAKAVQVKAKRHEALYNWGTALADQAKTKSGAEAERLLDEAKEKLLRVVPLSPGTGAYNQACISALRGEETECEKWLNLSRKFGKLPSKEHLQTDPDLERFHERDWFKALLAEI